MKTVSFQFFRKWISYIVGVLAAYDLIITQFVEPSIRDKYLLIALGWSWQTWLLIILISLVITFLSGNFSDRQQGRGGKGGNARVKGDGAAFGGRGGGSGVYGRGGDGGNAEIDGDGFAMGGEGGEAGQIDRGGRGGRSPFEILGIPNEQLPDGSWLWDKGRGGDGAGPTKSKEKDQDNEQ
jgi:hypothetical protein